MTLLRALRRLPPIETTVLVLAIVALAVLANFGRPVDDGSGGVPLDSFSSFDASPGGYRAFSQLLEREGIRVERFQLRPAFLTHDVDTLVYSEPSEFDPRQVRPSDADIAALEAWVRGGGRLLYLGHDDEAAKRGILHLPPSTSQRGRVGARPAFDVARAGITRLDAGDNLRWKRGRFAFTVLVADARGPLAVAYPLGRGHVVAEIDENLFRNGSIATADRARFAFAIAQPNRSGGVVSFYETVHGFAAPNRWWTLVPRAFAVALCLALATIVIALFGAAVRFGPPIVPVERRDRSSADFIDALATLLERGRAMQKALVDARASTTRAIARAFGVPDESTLAEIDAHLDDPELRNRYRSLATLAERDGVAPQEFVRGLALAQQLRKEFAAHGRPRT